MSSGRAGVRFLSHEDGRPTTLWMLVWDLGFQDLDRGFWARSSGVGVSDSRFRVQVRTKVGASISKWKNPGS